MSALQTEEQILQPVQSMERQRLATIAWEAFMEEEEFELDRRLRLQREEEEAGTAGLTGRLTAPESERRQRPKKAAPSKTNYDDTTAQLRAKQMKLIDEQIKLQKVLLENAMIAQEEAKERVKLITAQRQSAEIELRSMQRNE